jgi:hypothetical protein
MCFLTATVWPVTDKFAGFALPVCISLMLIRVDGILYITLRT